MLCVMRCSHSEERLCTVPCEEFLKIKSRSLVQTKSLGFCCVLLQRTRGPLLRFRVYSWEVNTTKQTGLEERTSHM